MKEIYIKIDGGAGRVISATGVVDEFARLKKEQGINVNVVSSYPQMFLGLDNLTRVYNIAMPYLYEDYILKGEFIEPEPYNNHLYYAENKHLVSVFNFLLNGKEEFIAPKIVLTENEKSEAQIFIEQLRKDEKKKILLIQPWGSSGGIVVPNSHGEMRIKQDESYRSFGLEFFTKLVSKFKEDYVILSVQATANLGNGQQTPQAVLPFTKPVNNPDIRKIIALIPYVDGIIACDSMLHHASAGLGTPVPTYVLWGGTSPENLSYPEHKNFLPKRKVMIEPNRVPHDHALYVNKNKGINDFDLDIIDEIKKELNKK
jgi:ADP-heptose:LPS heptosyltransferase